MHNICAECRTPDSGLPFLNTKADKIFYLYPLIDLHLVLGTVFLFVVVVCFLIRETSSSAVKCSGIFCDEVVASACFGFF